ncbi:hypothetical protein UlMin_005422 [Ulmus minor]
MISQNIFGALHLIVSLGIILAMDKILKKAFVVASIKFPSALFRMFCIFSVLIIQDSIVPATGFMNFFQPALLFIQRWQSLFYVPTLVVFPLSKLVFITIACKNYWFSVARGWLARLCVAGFTAIAIIKMVKTKMVDVEPMSNLFPFSIIELWSWSGIPLISFVGALFYLMALGTSARTCLPFLLTSTVLGYIVGTGLPSDIKKVFHPIICCALSADLTAKLSQLVNYLMKVSSNPGAGDVLMGFLGSIILSFAFSMFKHRKVKFFQNLLILVTKVLSSLILIGCLLENINPYLCEALSCFCQVQVKEKNCQSSLDMVRFLYQMVGYDGNIRYWINLLHFIILCLIISIIVLYLCFN